MTADAKVAVAQPDAAGPAQVEIDAVPDAAWLARYRYRGQRLPPVAIKLLTSAPWQAFGSVRSGGETIAIGRVAHAGDWAGLRCEKSARRRFGGSGKKEDGVERPSVFSRKSTVYRSGLPFSFANEGTRNIRISRRR